MAHTPKNLTTGGWVRLVIYVVGSLIGLAALVAAILGFNDLALLMGTIAGGAASVTGGTAIFNLEKAPDNKTPVDAREVLPAFLEIMAAAREYGSRDQEAGGHEVPAPAPVSPSPDPAPSGGNPTLDQLRDLIASNRQG